MEIGQEMVCLLLSSMEVIFFSFPVFGCVQTILAFLIDDLQKSRGLHSVSAYGHGLYII